MENSDETEILVRVAMAKRIARSWVEKVATPEHRLTIYLGSDPIKNISGLIRSFRDGKLRLAGMSPLYDLGVQNEFDKIILKSRNREALSKLNDWLTEKGFETTGLW